MPSARARKRIAVIGAGPVGIEAALYGVRLDHDVQVFERGSVGANVRSWGHVRLFSPWKLNHSSLGAATLRGEGAPLPQAEAYLTGHEYARRYLAPLARSAPLDGRIREGVEVVSVGRDRIGKSDLIGGDRDRYPFRLLLEDGMGERVVEADAVLDCSGTYGRHNWMGNGNVPAVGERGLRDRISYTLEDLAATDRPRYEGRRVLLVGSGYSAATALDALIRLEATTVAWVSRRTDLSRLRAIPDDPLPERARLSRLAHDLAGGGDPRVRFLGDRLVERVEESGEGFVVTLGHDGTTREIRADRILAHVGYHPDGSIHRELQIHECYATSGSMKLAAALLADDGADCLAQTPKGPETLRHPEPNFFTLGAKSYGRNSSFLIHIGLEQVREAYSLIEDRPGLNLYAA